MAIFNSKLLNYRRVNHGTSSYSFYISGINVASIAMLNHQRVPKMSMSNKRGTSHQPGRDTEHVLMAAFVTSGGRSGGWKLFNWIPQKSGGTYIYMYLYYIIYIYIR